MVRHFVIPFIHPSDGSLPVKGFYVCWMNDPPNPKIKDWNVTELKVGGSVPFCPSPLLKAPPVSSSSLINTVSSHRLTLTGDTWTSRPLPNSGRSLTRG